MPGFSQVGPESSAPLQLRRHQINKFFETTSRGEHESVPSSFINAHSGCREGYARKLIADAYRQENVFSYRWRVALYAELASPDDAINIGTGVRFTFRIFSVPTGEQ